MAGIRNDGELEFIADANTLTWDSYDEIIASIIEQYYDDFGNTDGIYLKIYAFHIAPSPIASEFSKSHEKDLLQRIRFHDFVRRKKKVRSDLLPVAEKIIDFLIEKGIFSYQRKTKLTALKKFLVSLLNYKILHDSRDNRKLIRYNFWHPGHYEKRKAGLYPLARNQLRKWHGHYNEVMPILIKAGIIEKSNYGYRAGRIKGTGACLYYRINIEKFFENELI